MQRTYLTDRVGRVGMGLLALGCCVLLAAQTKEAGLTKADFDWELYGLIFTDLKKHAVENVNDLITEWESDVASLLPVSPPAPDYPLNTGHGRSRLFDPKSLPDSFIEGLLPVVRKVGDASYVAYPVVVREDATTRDRVVYAADGTELARAPAPKDYDPFWLIRAQLDDAIERATDRRGEQDAYTKWLMSVYDPSRIIARFDLVTEEAAQVLTAARTLAVMSVPPGGDAESMMMSQEDVTNLCIAGISTWGTNGAMSITVAWPETYTNRIGLIACTNLIDQDWSLLLTTNPPINTNCFVYIDDSACTTRFHQAWNADHDADGDGIGDMDERLNGTDPENENDPPNITGTIGYQTYSGGQTGTIYVIAVATSNSWSTNYCDVLAAPGTYHIVDVPTNSYWVKVWRDADEDGSVGTYEAVGIYTAGTVVVMGHAADVNIVLTDPDTDSDGMGDWWELQHWQDLGRTTTGDEEPDKLQNLYEYYAGTDPRAGSDSDEDGMSDDWEDYYGLNPADSADAADDPDNDGFTNLDEYELVIPSGTDPTNPMSHPPYFVDVTATAFPNDAPTVKASWGDYDNDGDPDLYANGVWRNDSNVFTLVANTSFGEGIWLDSNNDGHLDIFSWAAEGDRTKWGLYTNRLATGFSGFARDATFPQPEVVVGSIMTYQSRGACAFDFNIDGFIDLYVAGYEDSDQVPDYADSLVRNNTAISSCNGGWEKLFTQLAESDNAHFTVSTTEFDTMDMKGGPVMEGKGVTACDYDADGDPDIYVSNYRITRNLLWEISDADATRGAGAQCDVARRRGIGGAGHSIGSAWGDFDNDGMFDLFVANLRHAWYPSDYSQFYRNMGSAAGFSFESRTATVNLPWQEGYGSPAAADFDKDGNLDLFVTCAAPGYIGYGRLFRNDGNWSFTEITEDAGLPTGGGTNSLGSYQAAWADYDGDGDLDLLTRGKLYKNQMGARNWLELRLSGDGATVNKASIGAIARLEVGGLTLVRQVEGATGEGNQNDFALHFGLGTNAGPVAVTVTWPGQSPIVFTNLAANTLHVLQYSARGVDDFDEAEPLSALSGRLTVRNGGATIEQNEPEHSPWSGQSAARSLWWTFSSLQDGCLTLTTQGSIQTGVVVAVYSGSELGALSLVGRAGAREYDAWLVDLPVSSNQQYRIAIADCSTSVDNDKIALHWTFGPARHWAAIEQLSTDGMRMDDLHWIPSPVDNPQGGRPLLVDRDDIPNRNVPGQLLLWPGVDRIVHGHVLNDAGYEYEGMGEWMPESTGDLTVVDYLYEEGGHARVLYKRQFGAGWQAVLESGSVVYNDSPADEWDGWVPTQAPVVTNAATTNLQPFRLLDTSWGGPYALAWKGDSGTADSTNVVVDLFYRDTLIYVQSLTLTSTDGTVAELADVSISSGSSYGLLWQRTAATTNSAVIERYGWGGALTDSHTVSAGVSAPGHIAEPVQFVPASGSTNARLVWAYAVSNDWSRAIIQELNSGFSVMATRILTNDCAAGETRPVCLRPDGAGGWRLLWESR